MKKRILLFFGVLVIGFYASSQNLDSLYLVAKKIEIDSVKLQRLNFVGFRYIFRNPKKAKEIIDEALDIATTKKSKINITQLTNTKGIYMDVTGKSDSAKIYFEKALAMSRNYNFLDLESKCINNLGMVNWNLGAFNKALDYFFQSLKINDKLKNRKSSAIALNNIGLIYQEMSLSQKALEYHHKALKIREEFDLINDQLASLNNIGINLKDLGNLDEAEKIYKKAIGIAQEQKNLVEYYRLLENLGNLYNEQDKMQLALKTYLKALDLPKDYNADEKKICTLFSSISALYNEINKPKLAKYYVDKAFKLFKKHPELETISANLYLTSAETNYMLGNYKLARFHKNKFVKLKDSIFSEENAKALADFDIKYETEKKEKEILEQRTVIAENEVVMQKQNYQIYAAFALALTLGLLGYLFYNQQKLKNRQLEKEVELNQALVKIETQSKLQEQRLRISRDLHDNIGAQLTFIISSIDNLKYGFDIKDEKLNSKLNTISEFTSGTIYELRDTIWAMNKNEITFEDLQSRISNYIDKARIYDSNIKFNFNIDDSIGENKKFTSIEGMNIHRVVQEAMHNSLKYANASKIEVNVSMIVSNLVFKITDNGKGFDLSTIKRGNGLNNMEKRIRDIGGEITFHSVINKGTEVMLTI